MRRGKSPPRGRRCAPHTGSDRCSDAALQNGLAFNQWKASQVATIEPEHIKRHEVRPVATKQQVVETTAPVRTEADDFSVEHSIRTADRMRQLSAEIRPGLEDVSAARNQPAVMAVSVRQTRKPSYFTS